MMQISLPSLIYVRFGWESRCMPKTWVWSKVGQNVTVSSKILNLEARWHTDVFRPACW